MKMIKLILLLGVALAMSACATFSVSSGFDEDQYLGPTSQHRALDPSAFDPDAYMDQMNHQLEKMFAGPYGLP